MYLLSNPPWYLDYGILGVSGASPKATQPRNMFYIVEDVEKLNA